ncbi:MAG TPA: hypothetical protein VH741_11135 [Candidatus Limnocylindrales bacterium]
MDDEQADLRATAEDMIDDSQRVEELERRKLGLDAADPRFAALAHEIEDLVARMARKAKVQSEIAADAAEG